MKVATITFHAAHNFGSMLQAYALQTFVEELAPDISYEILNYRSQMQKSTYAVVKKVNNIKGLVKNLLRLPYQKQLKTKFRKFEEFLYNDLHITSEEINETCEVPQRWFEYDCYISGSDQIWNVRAKDFADINFLDFVNRKRISYAASFGPLAIDWNRYDRDKYSKLLEKFDTISVRETGSADNVRILTGQESEVHVDPTLLLDVNEWRKLQSDANYNDGKYILLYCLEPTKQQLKIAKAISKKLGLPIVSLKPANKNDIVNNFVKKYDAGPKDFLAYIDHAALVLTSSFHGTAFSLIYHKAFYSLNGMKDNRISSLLTKTKMTDHSIDNIDEINKVMLDNFDNQQISNVMMAEQRRSKEYLLKGLGLEND